ncbi:16515_t:CDS:1, partial [Cetraspora pellucida]
MAQTVAPTAMAQAGAMAFENQAKSHKPLTTLNASYKGKKICAWLNS